MTIAQQVLEEKIAVLSAETRTLHRLIVALVYEVGKGKNVSISKGNLKQADQRIGSIDFRQLKSGEIRFTVEAPKEGNDD